MSPLVVFVGDQPSPRMKPGARPFEGAACESRLKEWVYAVCTRHWYGKPEGMISPIAYDLGFDYEVYNQNDQTGIFMARLTVAILYPDQFAFIALGNNASKYLSKLDVKHFKLPHPSGLNRQINDQAFIAQRLTECRTYIESYKKY